MGVWQQQLAHGGGRRASEAQCAGRYTGLLRGCSQELIGYEFWLREMLVPQGNVSSVSISVPSLKLVNLIDLPDAH